MYTNSIGAEYADTQQNTSLASRSRYYKRQREHVWRVQHAIQTWEELN